MNIWILWSKLIISSMWLCEQYYSINQALSIKHSDYEVLKIDRFLQRNAWNAILKELRIFFPTVNWLERQPKMLSYPFYPLKQTYSTHSRSSTNISLLYSIRRTFHLCKYPFTSNASIETNSKLILLFLFSIFNNSNFQLNNTNIIEALTIYNLLGDNPNLISKKLSHLFNSEMAVRKMFDKIVPNYKWVTGYVCVSG